MMVSLFLVLMMAASCLAQTAETYRRDATEFARQKSWDQAIAQLSQGIGTRAQRCHHALRLALALKYKGEAKQAVDEFEAALRLKPKWADAQLWTGRRLVRSSRPACRSAKELQTAVRLAPANAAAHRLLARIYMEQSNPSSAKTELQQAIASKPSAELYTELGLAEGQLANLPAAAAAFRQALQLNPRFTTAYMLLGVTLRRQGDHSAALAQFHKAVAVDPSDPRAQFNLGKELKAGGDLAGAIAAFQRAIELKPDYEDAHYNLGIALRAQGQKEAGQKELNEINGLRRFRTRLAEAKLLILQGVNALKDEKLDDALGFFQKAIEKGPELPTGYYYLGLTWERKGDAAQAQTRSRKHWS